MGSENLFHKKRERNANDFKRKKQLPLVKQSKILIVCEDSKSSAFYLEDLAKDFGLNAVHVRGKECGSAPKSVLEFAQSEYQKSKDNDAYDRVYCVFDRDSHPCFDATVLAISNAKPKNMFFAITTTPCFEFWLILHKVYESSPYQTTGNKSPCDNVNSKLKLDWTDYGKNKRDIYTHTKDDLPTAIKNAKRLVAENQKNDSNNPQTNMHELVEYLQSIRRY
ncbi:MAG: RloB family protein [Methylotenera sp.]